MSAVDSKSLPGALSAEVRARGTGSKPTARGIRSVLLPIITVVLLVPVFAVILLALTPNSGGALTLNNFRRIFAQTDIVVWLLNSLQVAGATVVVSVVVGAPAGYVLSRGRGRGVRSYALILFVVQALPVITAVIPLFLLFAKLGLVDTLTGVIIVYVGSTVSIATWMMAAYIDTIPASLEEAAWVDGASVFRGFVEIVLRNSLPGILSTAVYTFLFAWNDYLVAVVFLQWQGNFTLPIGVSGFFSQHGADWGAVMATACVMMLPPIVIFALLNKRFSVGGIGGSLAGR